MYAPDSITDWYIDGYCLSSKNGLGISERKVLRVYQNLFVVTDMPSAVVSGEKFPVNIKVFNQMKFCTPVRHWTSSSCLKSEPTPKLSFL